MDGGAGQHILSTRSGHFSMEAQMPYAFTLTTTIPASAQEIYDAWLDSLGHSEMTGGGEASMSDEIDAEVSAWDGYITGRNLGLVPGERIVQSWRTTQFTEEHEDSIITLTLEEIEDGTFLTLVHSNVPEGQTSYEQGGWQEHYFEPMKKYFANRTLANAEAASKEKASKTRRKRAAPRRKSKRATPRVKTRVGRKKSRRTIAASSKSKRPKKAKSKPA
jgi:uncharacterized protein YndB with AHSA1/START domain